MTVKMILKSMAIITILIITVKIMMIIKIVILYPSVISMVCADTISDIKLPFFP